MRTNRDRLHELSDEYERRTGQSILLYISCPTPSSTRYVFTDHVSFTYDKAVQYVEKKLAKLTPRRYSQCDETCTSDCGHCKGER